MSLLQDAEELPLVAHSRLQFQNAHLGLVPDFGGRLTQHDRNLLNQLVKGLELAGAAGDCQFVN